MNIWVFKTGAETGVRKPGGKKMKLLRTAIVSAALVSAGAAYGQISDNVIKIGVLNDM